VIVELESVVVVDVALADRDVLVVTNACVVVVPTAAENANDNKQDKRTKRIIVVD
jgi:hypothetical protein